MRVLLVHEWLYTWAGAERVLEQLAVMLPDGEIVCGVVAPEMRHRHAVAAKARETWVGRIPGARRLHRWFLPLHAAAFATLDTRGYDLVISISHSFEKSVRVSGRARHVCYCLSPPRYLWDLRHTYDAMSTFGQRLALRAAAAPLRAVDRWAARGVHQFVSISRHVADRVRRSYGMESAVVYPPVAAKPSSPPGLPIGSPGAFLLSLGRLVPYKRVDLAVQAAERLQIPLVVAGDGPERGRLERIAGRYTQIVGEVTETEAARLLTQCTAFVFCGEEDFGIAPLEANAYGKPVVAYRRGAAPETLIEDETAVFFDRQDPVDVAEAIGKCLGKRWDPSVARANSERFAPSRFREQMLAQLERAMLPL